MKNATDEARALRMQAWNDKDGVMSLPVDPFKIAERVGVNVKYEELEPNVAGFILKEDGGNPTIYLNSRDGSARQRFTLAHELGHFISHKDEPAIGFVDYRDEISSRGTAPEEMWSNRFAAELLMPMAVVKKWWANGDSFESIQRRLGVSTAALNVRLSSLGLLS